MILLYILYYWIFFTGSIIPIIKAIPSHQLYKRKEVENDKILKDEGYETYKSILRNSYNHRYGNTCFSNALGDNGNPNIKIMDATYIYNNEERVIISSADTTSTTDNTNTNNNNSNSNSNTSNTTTNNNNNNYNNYNNTNIQHSSIIYSDTGFKECLGTFETYLYKKLYLSSKKKIPDFSLVLYPEEDGFQVNYKTVKTSMVTAFISFLYDHSEFWWIYSYRYSCEYSSKTNQVLKIEIDLCWSNDFCNKYSMGEIKTMNEALEDQKLKILNRIGNTEHKTSYQILRNIHDILINSVMLITSVENEDLFATTIYGTLVIGKCTSEGLAKTFRWFADYFKIITVLAVGYGYQWNFVKLNEKWYVVDVAGDAKRSTTSEISYDLFLIGFSEYTDSSRNLMYEDDITYNLIDRVKTTSNSLTYITYPEINIINFFDANGIKREDMFESTIMSISSDSTYSYEVVPDSTNEKVTTLISTFTTTVITVVQGKLNLTALSEEIQAQHKCQAGNNINITSINNNYNSVNEKNTAKTDSNSSATHSTNSLKSIKSYIYIF